MTKKHLKQYISSAIATVLTFSSLANPPAIPSTDECLFTQISEKLKSHLADLHAHLSFNGNVPSDILFRQFELNHFGAAQVNYLKLGGKLKYIVNQNGELWILDKSVQEDFSQGSLLMVQNKNLPTTNPFLATEYGELEYSKNTKSITMSPKFDIGLSAEEHDALVSAVKASEKTEPVSRKSSGVPKTKVMQCTDVLNQQSNGSNFVRSKLFADNMVATTAIITSEAMGAGRMKTEKGRDVVLADLIGTNYSSLIGGYVGKTLVLKGVGRLGDTAARAATAGTLITIQNGVYREVLQDDASKRANAISTFDAAHFAIRLPINRMVDNFILNKVPTLFFNACLVDSKAKLFISPTAIRLYERYGSTVIYYGLRKAIVNE